MLTLKDDPIFAKPIRGRHQMPVKHQLMVWLHFVGHEGNTCAGQQEVFKISKGLSQKEQACVNGIQQHMKRLYHLVRC
jgi:hypothetical protein